MARGVNRVTLIGNLSNDPEVRRTAGGSTVANIRIATSDSWTDKNTGQKQERTEWHRVVFFNRLAEIVEQYLTKGAKVYVEGSLQTQKWQDQSGQDRYTTQIVAREMQMLDSRNDSNGNQSRGSNQRTTSRNSHPMDAPPLGRDTGAASIDFDDDIPFMRVDSFLS